MTQKKLVNRIPAEDLEAYKAWVLPPIGGDNKRVLPSAQREASKRRAEQQKRRGEKVEDAEYQGTQSGLSAQELQAIVDEAEKEGRERGYKTGFEQGRSEGYEIGEKQGREEMRQKLAAEQQRFQHLVQSLRQPVEEQDQALEKLLLDTVCALTRSLVKRELLTDSSHILAEVKAAVAALPAGPGQIRLYLNPDDLALVEAYAEEQGMDWQFMGDEQLLPGGCRVETAQSQVDFSVEQQLAQQLEAFVNRQLGQGGDQEPDVRSISGDQGRGDASSDSQDEGEQSDNESGNR